MSSSLGERRPFVKRRDRMCRVQPTAVSPSTGKLLLLLYPSPTVIRKVMELHTRTVSTERAMYYSRQINKHGL